MANKKSYEDLISLQDAAIQALKQANEALIIALKTLEQARKEAANPLTFPNFGGFPGQLSYPSPFNPYVPNNGGWISNPQVTPETGPWNGQTTGNEGLGTVVASNAIKNSVSFDESLKQISETLANDVMNAAYIDSLIEKQVSNDAQIGSVVQ